MWKLQRFEITEMINALTIPGNTSLEKNQENPKIKFLWGCILRKWWIFRLHPIIRDEWGGAKCKCGKKSSCPGPGKHPAVLWHAPIDPNWKRASQHVAAHLERDPTIPFGLHLGHSRLMAWDYDPRNDNDGRAAELREHLFALGLKPHVHTGGGGEHWLFIAPAGTDPIRGFRGPNGEYRGKIVPVPGWDVLSGQHYIVLAFSNHKSGKDYVWLGQETIPELPIELVEMLNAQPQFARRQAPARPEPAAWPEGGSWNGTYSVDQARAWLNKVEPAVSGANGSRATGRVAAKLLRGFALPRNVAKLLLEEWNIGNVPPWTSTELDRKLDWGESGREPMGAMYTKQSNGWTSAEEELDKKFAEMKIDWGKRKLNTTTGEMFDEPRSTDSSVSVSGNVTENQGTQEKTEDIAERPEEPLLPAKPTCFRRTKRIFREIGTCKFCCRAFPCRKTSCEACFPIKQTLYRDTISRHINALASAPGDQGVPMLFLALVVREKIRAITARIRKAGGNFFAIESGGLGSIPGPEFLVISTVAIPGPRWQDVNQAEAIAVGSAAVDALPFGCQGRVWRSSNAWKLINDSEAPTKKSKLVGKWNCTMRVLRIILDFHNVELHNKHGKSIYFPWHGGSFTCHPDQVADILADLEAGDTLLAGVTRDGGGGLPADLPQPDVSGDFPVN